MDLEIRKSLAGKNGLALINIQINEDLLETRDPLLRLGDLQIREYRNETVYIHRWLCPPLEKVTKCWLLA